MAGGWNNGGTFPYPWREVVDSESPNMGSYSGAESMEQMLIDVDLTNYPNDAMTYLPGAILGYPAYIADQGQDFSGLSRALPMRHPFCNRMWAAKIVSRRGRPNDVGELGRKVTDAVSGMSYFRYNVQRLLIQFGCPPFAVLSDAQVAPYNVVIDGIGYFAKEFYRYVEKSAEFSIENITKKGRQYQWAKVQPTATGNDGLPPGEAANNTLPFDFIIRTGKATLRWTWHQVPGVALFGTDGTKFPRNILDAVGSVNNAAFPGPNDFPAGTLLFLPPKFIAEDMPVEPVIAGVPPGFPPRTYKVEMNVSYFDPLVDPNWNGNGAKYPFRGHNLQPSPSLSAMPYFYLTAAGPQTLPPNPNRFLYQRYDFGKIFRLIPGV